MNSLINITQARSNLSSIIDEVVKKGKKFILIRDSIPQAVIIPYEEVLEKEKNWQEEVKKMMIQGKKRFKLWLKKQGISSEKLSEENIYEIVNQVAGRP